MPKPSFALDFEKAHKQVKQLETQFIEWDIDYEDYRVAVEQITEEIFKKVWWIIDDYELPWIDSNI